MTLTQPKPIIKYKYIKEYTYKLPKVKYIKTDKDIYNVYKKDNPKAIDFFTFVSIIELCFKAALSKALDKQIVKLPFIGDIYLKYVKRKDGKPLIDYRRFKVLHHLTTFPRLKLDTKRKRYRNCNIYGAVASKQMKSFLFKKYIDN